MNKINKSSGVSNYREYEGSSDEIKIYNDSSVVKYTDLAVQDVMYKDVSSSTENLPTGLLIDIDSGVLKDSEGTSYPSMIFNSLVNSTEGLLLDLVEGESCVVPSINSEGYLSDEVYESVVKNLNILQDTWEDW